VCTASWRLGGAFSFSIQVVTDRPGYLAFRATGRDAARAFKHEAGGHRWQRVPPTERKGRVHTSTVTVAVLREPSESEFRLDAKDLTIKTCRGSGAGGQHRNTTASAVQVFHQPSGIQIRVESERSQHQNKASALALLRARLQALKDDKAQGARDARRRSQLGSGMRGDKRRTVALQRGQVTDHKTGKKISAKKYLGGHVEALWR
jgi:peptide chain release factor 1